MKVTPGILFRVANLLPVLRGSIPSSGDCNYNCPVIGVLPVCGSDGNTYPSQCHVDCVSRNQAAVSVRAPGRCPERPCICRDVVDHVCGTNGRTYQNLCTLKCDSRKQQRYGFPPIHMGSPGTCPDQGCVCSALVKPVCGTDWRTYGNACELDCKSRRQQLIGQPPIFINSYGVCPPPKCNCPLLIAPVCSADARSYRNICFLECASQMNKGEGHIPAHISSYGVCPQENCLCRADISPVCASNGNTYNNECALVCQNGRRFALGQPPLQILYRGYCRNCICPENYDPVCGSDDRTYGNLCQLHCENQRRQHQNLQPLKYSKGECGCYCSKVYQPVCASDFRTYGNLCQLGCKNLRRVQNGWPALHEASQGVCACNCSDVSQPVCGSDLRTYRNVCLLKCVNYHRIRNGFPAFTVVENGAC